MQRLRAFARTKTTGPLYRNVNSRTPRQAGLGLNALKWALIFTFLVMFAKDTVKAEVPPGFPNLFYENNFASVENFVLRRTCFSLPSSAIGYECNPSFLAENIDSQLNISFLTTNSIKKVLEYGEQTQDKNSTELIRKGLAEEEPLIGQSALNIWYRHNWWELTITPARLGIATDVRNAALPEMTTFAALEREISWKFGFMPSSSPHWKLGGRLRYVDAKFFVDQFEILSASVGLEEFEIKQGQALYFEPSLSYFFESTWHPILTLNVSDVALSKSNDEIQTSPLYELGYTTPPDFLNGRLTTALQVTLGDDLGALQDRVKWGGVLRIYKATRASFSFSNRHFALGVEGAIDSLILGLGYRNSEIDFGGYSFETEEQWLLRCGLTF